MASLLGPKLERAVIAFLTSNVSGVTICAAHGTAVPEPPYISVWCSDTQIHPDFQDQPGSNWPERATVEIFIKGHGKDAAFDSSVGQWAGEVMDAFGDGQDFRTAANGGDLYILGNDNAAAVTLQNAGAGVHLGIWSSSIVLEIDAQNGSPA